MILAGAVVLGLVVMIILFKPFFGNMDGFLECLRFWFSPDLLSMVRGEYGEDRWSELKLVVWFGLGGLTTWAVYAALT